MKQKSMRPAIFVLLTLALSAPTLLNILAGADSAMAAGVHLAGAILLSWVAVGTVGHLVDTYRASAHRRARQQHLQHQ